MYMLTVLHTAVRLHFVPQAVIKCFLHPVPSQEVNV